MPTDREGSVRFGAFREEWSRFSREFPGRLQTTVSNPTAKISPASALRNLGKVPSRYNQAREVVGIRNWPRRPLSQPQIRAAMNEPDYGICVILGRGLAAFDVDLEDEDLANLFETIAYRSGLRGSCVRYRTNSPRRLILVRLNGETRKRVLTANRNTEGCVELLGDGQQFVAAGTHPSGSRYCWREIREW